MRLSLFILLVFLSGFLFAQPAFQWGKGIGGKALYYDDVAYSCATDKSGNIYLAGEFKDTVDFDPGPGVHLLISDSIPYYWDGFVCKLSASGNFIWAKRFGGWGEDAVHAIAVNDNGDAFITGSFDYSADFDPDSGSYILNTNGNNSDIFICKLDSGGHFRWAKSIGGIGWDCGFGIALDKFSNVYTTGLFNNYVDFDPGPSVHTMGSGGYCDVFISELDSAGNYKLSKSFFCGGNDYGFGICVDNDRNIFTTGFFEQTADFDPGTGHHFLTSSGHSGVYYADAFVSKLDSTGSFVWVKQIATQNFDAGHSVASDAFGNVYVTGSVNGGGNGYGIYAFPTGGTDMFVSKYSANGNLLWNNVYGASDACGVSIACGSKGAVLTGYFNGNIDLDADSGTFILSGSSDDVFISVIDQNGKIVCGGKQGGSDTDIGYGVAIDGTGHIVNCGTFRQTVDLDCSHGICNVSSAGPYGDIFVSKFGKCESITEIEEPFEQTIRIFPVPAHNQIIISNLSLPSKVWIYDLLGNCLLNYEPENTEAKLQLQFPAGMYCVRIRNGSTDIVRKIVIE